MYLIGLNESKLNGRKSAEMSWNKPKEPNWALMSLSELRPV